MKYTRCLLLILSIFLFANGLYSVLQADVSITTRADKTSLFINQQLVVDIAITYPSSAKLDLFSFLYTLENQPNPSFTLVSSVVDKPIIQGSDVRQTVQLTLTPTETGILLFAPGLLSVSNRDYVVPGLKISCSSTDLLSLPLAGLLPLYPESRIDLNTANRMALLNKKVLQDAREGNKKAMKTYQTAWTALAFIAAGVAFGVLMLWCVVYFELLERAKRPKKVTQTPLEMLVREVQDKRLSLDKRWEKLIEALRIALGIKGAQNVRALSLYELADFVKVTPNFAQSEKELLIPAINTLGAISYAAKPTTDEEFFKMQKSMLPWIEALR